MGFPGDERVADQRAHREPVRARRFGAGDGEVVPFRRQGELLPERLERERLERKRAERERRKRIEREREARERTARERMERRRRDRAEWLRRERAEALRRQRRAGTAGRGPAPTPPAEPIAAAPPSPQPSTRPQIHPGVEGPVRKRQRAAENRRRAAARRKGLFWPTAKAGFAVTLVLGLSAGLGALIGLPVPGLDVSSGRQSLAGTASSLPLDPGTPPGLPPGYVFPVLGPHGVGEADARFGASRYGHVHEGQDIFAKPGTPEVAVRDGVVVDRGVDGGRDSGGRGNYLVIYDPAEDRSFVYMHMLKPSPLQSGDRVHTGQVIGRLGCSGSCWGPHLHFEIRIGKAALGSHTKALDPLPYLRQWPQATPG
jgi:murein DD-endopeptidase MepM/ murein hydrolase activator NlpD